MKNIMKAQLYQMVRKKFNYVMFVVLAIMQCTALIGEMLTSSTPVTGGSYVAENGTYGISVALMFALLLTGDVCGADFVDRTTNYELTSGHLRKDSYFGRAILSMAVGTIGTFILSLVPVVVATIAGGWGETLDLGDVLFRYVLSVFPILRVICEFVFLSFIVKNAYIVMAVGVIVSLYGEAWMEMFEKEALLFLGTGNLYKLFNFTSWRTYTLVDEKEIVVYDMALKVSDIAGTIAASVLIGGLFLMLGYLFFEKDDLN